MEQICNPIFDVTIHAFDTSSAVRLRSSPNLTPDRIFVLPFPVTLTTLTLNQRSSRRFGNYFWKSSPEGLPPSFPQLRAKLSCSRGTRRVAQGNLPLRTGSSEAVTRLRFPQNVACRFPALRSSVIDLQHSNGL